MQAFKKLGKKARQGMRFMVKGKVIGIIGGMGPEATLDLFREIIEATPASCDQEHIHTIIDSNPKIPSRVDAIFYNGESPAPEMVKAARNLEKHGADVLGIACNTAHYYYEDVRASVGIPVINMIEETVNYTFKSVPKIKKVGLLASPVLEKIKLYQENFRKKGIEVVTPDKEKKSVMLDLIFKVKSGSFGSEDKQLIKSIIDHFLRKNRVEALVLGCTEIPIMIKDLQLQVPIFNSTKILAEVLVQFALKR